jgi:hypothetical protein
VWNELVKASSIEQPMQIKEYCNDMVKKEYPSNPKVLVEFNKL